MKQLNLVWILCILSLTANATSCITCQEPILQNFSNHTANSVQINFIDVNGATAIAWEIELVALGNQPTGIATTDSIFQTNYLYTGLDAGKVYEIYLRSICEKGNSSWNGPFIFYTHLINGTACGLEIPIRDNRCNDYYIEVDGVSNLSLGADIFIEEINLSIQHTWPTDLKMELSSPNGNTVLLASNQGSNSDHYGDPSDASCMLHASFNNKACLGIEDFDPPFIGEFKPEGDINLFLDGSNPNGLWHLEICDQAEEDVGSLQHFEIKFSEDICPVPSDIVVNNIDDLEAEILWNPPFNCQFIEIVWGEIGFDPSLASVFLVNCQSGNFTMDDLLPDTMYEVYVKSKCNFGDSPFSCPIQFTTSCLSSSDRQNFDSINLCSRSCIDNCPIEGSWTNSNLDDHDWLVNTQSTPTSFTGPASDVSLFGNYIYIENTPSICVDGSVAELISQCLQVPDNLSNCPNLKFSYHMFGVGINKLQLAISRDNGENWMIIFEKSGDQGNQWHKEELSLQEYEGEEISLKFSGTSGQSEGDIALDQIELFGTEFIGLGTQYFRDDDLDGFGNSDTLYFCGIQPNNLSIISGDCDDSDASIHPLAEEIPCNLIDENCNGNQDDPIQNNPAEYSILSSINPGCLGSADGEISIDVINGSPPYQINWNNSMTGAHITALAEGVYYATITDLTGCKIQTEFIELDATTNMQLTTSLATPPSCQGLSDGMAATIVTGGNPPYEFEWSDGSTDSLAINLKDGDFYVTVTDSNGCQSTSLPIILSAPNVVNAGVQFKTDVNCFGEATGNIQIGVIQGNGPFNFEWDNGESGAFLDNLVAGFYSCTVSDINQCSREILDIEITQTDSIQIFIEGLENVRCHDGSDGKIEISIQGGTPQYAYNWNQGFFTEDLFNISEGEYQLTITDSKGCGAITDTIRVLQPEPLEIMVDQIVSIECPFSESGKIDLSMGGGTPNYSYFWDHTLENIEDLDSLGLGSYKLIVVDAFNCKSSIDTLSIESLNIPLEVEILKINDNLCFGDSTGSISSFVNSERFPIDFNWNAGVQNVFAGDRDTLTSLANGNYKVTITDAEGCVGTSEEITISSPERLAFIVDELRDLKCFEDQSGLISLDISGGITPYFLNWDNDSSDNPLTNLSAGTFNFELKDSNDCILNGGPLIIDQPEKLSIEADIINATNGQNNGQISLTTEGGVPFYFYQWSPNANTLNNPLANNLSSDTYTVNIKDANDCSIDTSFFVDNISNNIELDEIDFQLSPNPTHDFVNISSDISVLRYELISLDGKILKSNKLRNGFARMDVGNLSKGIYFIKLRSKDGLGIKKLIVSD